MWKLAPRIRFVPLILLVASIACSTTTFQSTWRSPEARPLRLTGRKVVALFLSKKPAIRRRAEDAMAREITARGAQGVPGYTILSDQEISNQEAARAKVEQLGYSGVVVMRVVGRETQYSYEPAYWSARPYYRRFWGGYWAWGWATVGEPGYLAVDKIVSVETLVYSLEQDQLVWAGVSKTVNPERVEDFIAELAKSVTKEMAKEGLLTKT